MWPRFLENPMRSPPSFPGLRHQRPFVAAHHLEMPRCCLDWLAAHSPASLAWPRPPSRSPWRRQAFGERAPRAESIRKIKVPSTDFTRQRPAYPIPSSCRGHGPPRLNIDEP